MTPKELKRRTLAGEQVYGTQIVSTAPIWPAAVAQLGLDFVFIDTEHIAVSRGQLSEMCQAYRALGVPPLVRIPSPDPFEACKAIDGGAAGIVAPYVETAQEARKLVGAVKYRPLKGRRLAGALDGTDILEPAVRSFLDRQNEGNLLVVMIESRPAVEALDEILAVPGIDAVLVGPQDLSCTLGIPEQYDHPEFERTVRTIFAKGRARGIGAGVISWLGIAREVEWARAGANLLVHEGDITTFLRAARADFQQLRQKIGTGPT